MYACAKCQSFHTVPMVSTKIIFFIQNDWNTNRFIERLPVEKLPTGNSVEFFSYIFISFSELHFFASSSISHRLSWYHNNISIQRNETIVNETIFTLWYASYLIHWRRVLFHISITFVRIYIILYIVYIKVDWNWSCHMYEI